MAGERIISKDLGPVSAYAIAKAAGYTGSESDWAADVANIGTRSLDAEAFAAGTRGGEAVASDDPAYHNNAAYFLEQTDSAKTIAVDAAGTATSAKTDAQAAKVAAEAAQAAAETAASTEVSSWLDTHYPTRVEALVDNTLTTANAAADAQVTGASIGQVLAQTAPEFDTDTAYTAGSYVTYGGTLYRFTADHAAGSWAGNTDTTAVTVSSEINDLQDKSGITDDIIDALTGEMKTVKLTQFEGTKSIVGATAVYDSENNKLKIYGTTTATRRFVCLNGQNIAASTTTSFSKTLPAGIYKVRLTTSGNIVSIGKPRLHYTTSTYGNSSKIAYDGDIIKTSEPIMVGLYIVSGQNYGTEESPSVVGIEIVSYTAKANETEMQEVYDYYNKAVYKTRNLFMASEKVFTGGYNGYFFDPVLPAGTYTFSADIRSTATSEYSACRFTSGTAYGDEIYTKLVYHNKGRIHFSVTSAVPIKGLFVLSGGTTSSSIGYTVQVIQPQIEAGESETAYVPPLTAIDGRQFILESTGDTTDRSSDILGGLAACGEVKLAKGDYYVSGIRMPDNTKLCGSGAGCRIILASTSDTTAITLGNKCTVSDIDILGSTEDITPDGIFAGTSQDVSSLDNEWDDSDQTVGDSGFKHMVLTTPLPAGTYLVTADVASDNTSTTVSTIAFADVASTNISSDNIIASASLSRGTGVSAIIDLDKTAYSVRLLSGTTVGNSDGYGATFENIVVQKEPSRCGIAWRPKVKFKSNSDNEDYFYGFVSNCRISGFNCAGILMMDSGTPTNRNLHVENCSVRNCNVGLYIRKDSEFNKITNCTFTQNYYGMLNRGGNNVITNCGFDSNTVGVQYDEDEGDNSGHGSMSNCTINHAGGNTGYGIIIRNTGRILISNCNLYFSKVKLDHTNGNVFSGCGFGNDSGLEIIGGQCSLFIGCMMRDTSSFPIAPPVNNTTAKMINCYYRNGNAVVYPPVNNET